MTDEDRAHLVARGIGITNLVARATARATELTRDELRAGGERLVQVVAAHDPRVVAVLGLSVARAALARRDVTAGRQPEGIGAAALWIVPNPSGLNAHDTIDTLAAAYAAPAREAGILA
jgi:TDG/mug DNA glycosylase family protein